MASPADGINLDNDNSRDGAASVASMTPAPSPAQTPSPPMPTRGPLHSDPTRPPHLCQPCAGDEDGAFRDPGPGLGAGLDTTLSPTPTMASIGTLLTPNQLLGGGGLGNLQAAAE